MSKLAEILRTLQDDETVAFSRCGLLEGIRIVAFKDIDKMTGSCQVSRIVTDSLMNLSIIEEPEAIELQGMLKKLREHVEGKSDELSQPS
jgi:hypothetical protein